MKYKYAIIILIILLFLFLLYSSKTIEHFTDIKPLKVAVFFSGRIKDYELEIEHLKKLKNTYNATFFTSINESSELDYMTNFFREFDISDDQKNIEPTPSPSELLQLYCPNDPKANYLNIFSMFYHNYKCYDLINKYQIKNNTFFDIIVKYRVDIHSDDVINLIPPELNTIYIPEGKDYTGINDQIAYGDNESMNLYCSTFKILSSLCMKNIRFHPESLLDGGLKLLNLKIVRFPYNYDLHKNLINPV